LKGPERRLLRIKRPSLESSMNDRTILEHVNDLIEEERSLRESLVGGASERLTRIEEELDQCWDLLRQRRAKREFGDDPERAQPRDADTVEHYIG
jgi:hypothetical protein